MARKLSADALTTIAQSAGFSRAEALTAAGIALAESGGDRDARGGPNSNGTYDYGLWQINSVHKELLAKGSWRDPDSNARMAYSVYKGSGWKAWTTYNTGAYRKFIPKTIPGAEQVGNVLAGDTPGGNDIKVKVPSVSDIPGAISGAVASINKQVGRIAGNTVTLLVALVLLGLGVMIVLRIPAGKAAAGVAAVVTPVGKVAKVAAVATSSAASGPKGAHSA